MNLLNTSHRMGRRALLLALATALLSLVAFAHDGMEHVQGTVSKVSDQSVTVTTAGGKAVEVMLDGQTTYARRQADGKSELECGRPCCTPRQGERNHAYRSYRCGQGSDLQKAVSRWKRLLQ